MPDKETKILETIAEAIPQMSEFDKGYLLGKAEGMLGKNTKQEKRETISKTLDESK